MAGENNATTNDALQPFLGRELLGQASSQASLVHVFTAALPLTLPYPQRHWYPHRPSLLRVSWARELERKAEVTLFLSHSVASV